jgi:glycosyltransferase involved in cell wall biosynthesis
MTNMIAPYRIPLYERLAEHYETWILYSGNESNRSKWDGIISQLKKAQPKQSWGLTIRRRKKAETHLADDAAVFDYQFTHITPGYFWDLVRIRPHAVISNEMGFRSLAALLYGTLFRRPVWIWWGGTMHTERSVGGARKLVRSVIRRWAKRWISYGLTSTEYLESIGISRNRILQIQNCVDESRFRADIEPAMEWSPRPVLLHVGQLIARKGLAPLLNAVAEIQRQDRQLTLVLVGDGPDRERLETQASELGLNNVVFLGGKGPAEMPAIYRSADALVFPTLEDVWGLVANEAVLSGLPVVCSKFAGCAPELFDPEQIFDPTDHVDFVRAIKLVVDGQVPVAALDRLKTTQEVAEMILSDLSKAIER